MSPDSLRLTRPDERRAVLPDTARRFGRAIVMPNLATPVRRVDEARAYRDRILAAVPAGSRFEPLMTLYLTESTTAADIAEAKASGFVHALKYYPAGATTNSQSGVTDLSRCEAVFDAMQSAGLPLLLHGEVTDSEIDIFDREAVFIDRHLQRLAENFPRLKLVLEHVTTREGIEYVRTARNGVAATLTAHHLLWNRNALFRGGLRPHAYCLPVLKREQHRVALLEAAISGDPRFFLGTDSAPHARHTKESGCGCAGIYTAHAGIELYAEAFDSAGALDKLEAFASFHGPDFYGLPRNSDFITLLRQPCPVPEDLPLGDSRLVPMRAGESVAWTLSQE
jgi:dihydroorotase